MAMQILQIHIKKHQMLGQAFQQKQNMPKVLYMSSSFGLLGVEPRDFSQAEKERTACKPEQIHKMTT